MSVGRTLALVAAGALLVGACSNSLSLPEYAAEVEAIVGTHNAEMDQNDEWLDSEPQTLERVQTYATLRMETRSTFLQAIEDLAPPREAKDLQTAAVETLRSLVAAEDVLFQRAISATDLAGVGDIWATPAGQAARAADAQAIAICQAAEAAINSTEERQALVGMPWVPTELQKVVNVAFGCTADQR